MKISANPTLLVDSKSPKINDLLVTTKTTEGIVAKTIKLMYSLDLGVLLLTIILE